jgi:hypothetical protein
LRGPEWPEVFVIAVLLAVLGARLLASGPARVLGGAGYGGTAEGQGSPSTARGRTNLPGVFTERDWFMSLGERASLEGILSALRPSLSIEIGTWSGGSLDRISAHSEAVHAIDLVRHPNVTDERFPNVTFHVGDSHELLPGLLAALAAAENNVDFVLVDGDHSAQGVHRDLEDLLASSSVGRTIILVHDTLNERVRAGLERVDFEAFDKVSFVELDFVPGQLFREGGRKDELWCGLGLVITGWDLGEEPVWPAIYEAPDVFDTFVRGVVAGHAIERPGYQQFAVVERELAFYHERLASMEGSWSWRWTAPLRTAKGLVRRALGSSGGRR